MREILYRAIHDKTNQWIYGHPFSITEYNYTNIEAMNCCDETGYWRIVPIKPKTLGIYSQWKDQKGNRVFEGDIVRLSIFQYTVDAVVKWSEDLGLLGAEAIASKGEGAWLSLNRTNILEVLGSVHATPELLEELAKGPHAWGPHIMTA